MIEKYFQSKKVKKQTTAIARGVSEGVGVARIQASKVSSLDSIAATSFFHLTLFLY